MQTCRSRSDAANAIKLPVSATLIFSRRFQGKAFKPTGCTTECALPHPEFLARQRSPSRISKPPSHTPTGFVLASTTRKAGRPQATGLSALWEPFSWQWPQIDHCYALVSRGSPTKVCALIN